MPLAELTPATALKIEINHVPVVSWVAEHCGIPLIRGLKLTCSAGEALPASMVEVHLEPGLGKPLALPIPPLAPGTSFEFGHLDYRLPAGHLRQVLERERAEFVVAVIVEGETYQDYRSPVEVLPCHHWPGAQLPLGLLCSFITPNHPVVAQVIKLTANRILAETRQAGLVGYQERNPGNVKAQVVALIQTIQTFGLSYVGVPASFEAWGQKVRFPDMILRDQLANCLDMTLLCAACLEQMGLRPLVMIIQGHAFPGVWLCEDRFPEGVVEDAARLRNQIALEQILVWDSSPIMENPALPFARLQELGEGHLKQEDTFQFALDVRVMRDERFHPLPLRDAVAPIDRGALPMEDDNNATHAELRRILEEAARTPETDQHPAQPQTPIIIPRWQRWKDRLLDLSLRNKLLNFKPNGAAALPLEVPELAQFEDLLADHKVFEVHPRPAQDSRDSRDMRLLAQRGDAKGWLAQRTKDLKGLILHSSLSPVDLIKTAKELESQARTDMEEGGICTLFVAIGILRWFEPGTGKERFAPLMLYPVQVLFNRQQQRVCIQRLEEDPIPNVTLIEKMRRDCNVDLTFLAGLDSDASGLDMVQMLRQAREAIQKIPRWEVLEEVHIGHFTFAKFLMWKDLEDNEGLLQRSPIVQHLAQEQTGSLPDQPPAAEISDLEAQLPGQMPCVVDADSTQLAAVASALGGRSFVLQGPPGTGKSQTIANIIAASLAAKRSVLFVSEKRAALEVVFTRLKQAGLGDFCLELHSNKANRKEVMESLANSLRRATTPEPKDWGARERELQEHRDDLNAYAEAIHRVHPIGFSLFEGSAKAFALRQAPRLPLRIPDIAHMSSEALHRMTRMVETFAHRAEALGSPQTCCWQGTDPASWTFAGQAGLETRLGDALESVSRLLNLLQEHSKTLGFRAPTHTQGITFLARIMETLAWGPLPQSALDAVGWQPLQAEIEAFLAEEAALERRVSRLMERWQSSILKEDLGATLETYRQHADTTPLLRWFFLWGAEGRLKKLTRETLPAPQSIIGDLVEAMAIAREQRRMADERDQMERRLRPTPLADLPRLASQVPALHQGLAGLRATCPGTQCNAWLERLWTRSSEHLTTGATTMQEALQAAQEQSSPLLTDLAAFQKAVEDWPAFREQLANWQRGQKSFKPWCFYREAARELEQKGLAEIPKADLEPEQILPAFERTILESWCAAIRDQSPALRSFEGGHHHRKVSQFRELDRNWIQLSRAFVTAQLDNRLPRAGASVSEDSEMGILLREIKKKTRHMAIRRLLQAIPHLLPRLKPCLLMSPLSVAQYLPAEGEPFDLLVFDEASQITTHDAIGALARGRQVIVVGDSKQLPPTSFFTRNLDDESSPDDNDVTELDSVLDEAVAKQFPQQSLDWHYRSRHHSLIDFSNRNYYDNRLHVFPAAARQVSDLGIVWHSVPDGVYFGSGCSTRSQERTNPREAERLVCHLVDSLRKVSPTQRTFGVVTFSMSQQRLIQELLEAKRSQYPDIEPHFQSAEPVFIKNLENVQGDERDEILFSIGYAKDQRGRLRMHFGPLSVSGGERRLNVAITRARCQLRVFSTLTHDQIDLNRTSSRGAEHLRNFLRYASMQGEAEGPASADSQTISSFEEAVARIVEAQGYKVHFRVGCGGYRLDLAVVDPKHAGRYLLGIELDGPAYGSAIAARDRDRLRQQVLEGLGWQLHRIWSSDWATEQEGEERRLQAALERASSKERPLPAREVAVAAPPPTDRASNSHPLPEICLATSVIQSSTPYQEASLTEPAPGDPEAFYHPHNLHSIRRMIILILALEAPLHRDDLDGKLVRAWGWSALTQRGRSRMDLVISTMERSGEVIVQNKFVWRPDQAPTSSYVGFRTPGPAGPRDATRIPPEEIGNAMEVLLRTNIAMEEETILRETARALGYQRVTSRTTEAMKAGLNPLLAKDGFTKNGVHYSYQG